MQKNSTPWLIRDGIQQPLLIASRLSQSDEHFPTNIGNPRELTILEFAERIHEHFPNTPVVIHEPLPEDDPKQRRPDITKARKVLAWEPKVSLEEGLASTLEFSRSSTPSCPPAAELCCWT